MRRGREVVRIAVAVLMVAGAAVAGAERGTADEVPLVWTAPRPLSAFLAGGNGVSRAMGTGLGCDGVELVDDTHLLLTAPVPAGTLSSLPATANANLGLAGERLETATSHVTLGDERGTVRLRLDGGVCPRPVPLTLTANGLLTGTGALEMIGGTGAYRSATLTGGAWSLAAGVEPGADNPWGLGLLGQLAVLAPGLRVEVVRAYWGNLGIDYVTRVVTVQYRITNPGPGDSFGTVLTGVAAGPGVTALGPVPQPLGDLLAGQSRTVTLRYQLGLLQPCQLIILGCVFPTTLTTALPDALDRPGPTAVTVTVRAPDLPPPL